MSHESLGRRLQVSSLEIQCQNLTDDESKAAEPGGSFVTRRTGAICPQTPATQRTESGTEPERPGESSAGRGPGPAESRSGPQTATRGSATCWPRQSLAKVAVTRLGTAAGPAGGGRRGQAGRPVELLAGPAAPGPRPGPAPGAAAAAAHWPGAAWLLLRPAGTPWQLPEFRQRRRSASVTSHSAAQSASLTESE